jgi:hypothetical protein
MLPFDRAAFLDVFSAYNEAVWPAQPIAWLVGVAALAALLGGEDRLQRFALWALAAMWLWTGLAYHWLFFSEINPAAILFGLLFALQAALLALVAAGRELAFRFAPRPGAAGALGAALIGYAAIVYPLVDLALGHWPRMPAFGISPCPLALYTLGLLLLARPRPPGWLWAVPVAWSLIGGAAAFLLGIVQDWVLLASGPAALMLAYFPRRRLGAAPR